MTASQTTRGIHVFPVGKFKTIHHFCELCVVTLWIIFVVHVLGRPMEQHLFSTGLWWCWKQLVWTILHTLIGKVTFIWLPSQLQGIFLYLMYFHDQMHFKFILFAPIVRPRYLHLVLFRVFFFPWLLKLYSSLFLLHFPLVWWLSFSKHCSECTRIILMLCSEKAQVFFC